MVSGMTENTPLLQSGSLPRFGSIEPSQVEPAMTSLLKHLNADLDALEASAEPTWEELIEPLERLGDRLAFSWGVVGHLMGVKNSDEMRAAHEAMQPEVVRFSMRLGQSRPLYDAAMTLRNSAGWDRFEPAQKRIVESLIRDAQQAGVALEGAQKERFNEIQLELAELSTQFSNHVLDATKAFSLQLDQTDDVDGLPQSALELAAQAANNAAEPGVELGATAESGPWRFTLDPPSLIPFLEHATRRDLREKLYRAQITRASQGDLDNAPLIERILELRCEESELLGFENYAQMSLSRKMANDAEAVHRLLEQLRVASIDAARSDLNELQEFARGRGFDAAEGLRHWDIAFWAQRLREERFDYSEEQLRPYFPLPVVLKGLFDLTQRLFGVRIEAADGEAEVWHPDVRFFRVRDADGEALAAFFLDPFSRPAEKRGGAWMDECLGRSGLLAPAGESVRLPVAYLICNGTPPVGDRPSLMTFHEVETLFHEFGHGLQHMLTRIDYGLAAGISNIEWDAVELPSQFMENWCYHRETLQSLTSHHETGESLPEALYRKLLAARTYRAGSDMLRQLYFAVTDLELHAGPLPEERSAFDVQRDVAQRTTVLEPLEEDRFLCSFGHIFAGGYAAGYYSYKWAEVLSADAFGAFEEAGLDNSRAIEGTGRRYRETVLALGGSEHPMDVFVSFRGREPTPEALLRHAGLG